MGEKTSKEQALELAQLLEDGKADDVTVIEVTKLTSCADFFVIATIHSSAHWQGLAKQIKRGYNTSIVNSQHIYFI